MDKLSEKQLLANQGNSLKGGVKSADGKAVVRFNARKHGILGNLVARYEDSFYKNYVEELLDEFQPSSIIENILVERIALYYLKLYRLTKAEMEFLRSCIEPTKFNYGSLLDDVEKGYMPIVNAAHMHQF